MRYTQQARPDPHGTHHSVLYVSVYGLCRDAEQVGRLADRPEPSVVAGIQRAAADDASISVAMLGLCGRRWALGAFFGQRNLWTIWETVLNACASRHMNTHSVSSV